ncbi:MAG: hypothetical protein M3442_21155 [Chloroflexota bacterium]|nr:hypothetical protein [Chloroflexota bacterium]
MAKLVPLTELARPRVLGTMRGLIDVPDDFDASMPAEWLAEFYGVDPEEIDVAVEVQDRVEARKASTGGVAPSSEAEV